MRQINSGVLLGIGLLICSHNLGRRGSLGKWSCPSPTVGGGAKLKLILSRGAFEGARRRVPFFAYMKWNKMIPKNYMKWRFLFNPSMFLYRHVPPSPPLVLFAKQNKPGSLILLPSCVLLCYYSSPPHTFNHFDAATQHNSLSLINSMLLTQISAGI